AELHSPTSSCTATATTQIYTLSLHDALPIFAITDSTNANTAFALDAPGLNAANLFPVYGTDPVDRSNSFRINLTVPAPDSENRRDRKSTRLNSSHVKSSYAVFCLKNKTNNYH